MNKKKICFIAQFPPPVHGLSKAVEELYHSHLAEEFEFEKVNLTDHKKILVNLYTIQKSKAELFYFTISQTKAGNLRDLIIMKLLALGNKKCIIHLHGGYYRTLVERDLPVWQKKANYRAIARLSGAIVLGQSLKSIFQGLLPDEKLYIIPNCVDNSDLISDKEFEEKWNHIVSKKIKHVLYLSNFIPSKGYREVLELARLEKENRTADHEGRLHFDFAGAFFDKSEEEFFFGYIKEQELQEYVTYHGVVEGEQKRELLKQCDIFILLTCYTKEGQPISILEAMGNGMLIITTDHAGIPDIVKDGVNGMVIKSTDVLNRPQSVINNIFLALEKTSTSEWLQIFQNNRQTVLSQYTKYNYLSEIGKLFRGGVIPKKILSLCGFYARSAA